MDKTSKVPQDKRSAIMEAALDLLSERGFHNAPMSLIVKTSGVSAGNIYHYFESKDELIREIYFEIKKEFLTRALSSLSGREPYQTQYINALKVLFRYYIDHPNQVKFLEQYEQSPYYDGRMPDELNEMSKPILAFFTKGIKEGILKDLPVPVLSNLGMASVVALAKQHMHGVITMDDELIDQAVKACWDAIKVR